MKKKYFQEQLFITPIKLYIITIQRNYILQQEVLLQNINYILQQEALLQKKNYILQ